MSGRNRRRRPATAEETRRLVAELQQASNRVERLYLGLLGSGYSKPHRKDTQQLGDPADLVDGTPARVRHLLTRASEGLDAAHEGTMNAGYWLAQIVLLLDEQASPGGIDEDLPTVSGAEVKAAQKAQQRRDDRVRQSGAPWAFEEITG